MYMYTYLHMSCVYICMCICVCMVYYLVSFSCVKVSHPSNVIRARQGHPSGKAATVRQRVLQRWYGGRARQKILMMMMIGRGMGSVCMCS